jgi:SAM-dependent methyltransferase
MFEAIYYIPDVDALLAEVSRLLRPGGVFLVATANKDLVDFNPSPFSQRYFNPPELKAMFAARGFSSSFLGGSPVPEESAKSRLIRWAKKTAVRYHLIPGSMKGKRLLKRLVFGRLVQMPLELKPELAQCAAPVPIADDRPDTRHLVLYCAATKN